jgi:hypothetical protein
LLVLLGGNFAGGAALRRGMPLPTLLFLVLLVQALFWLWVPFAGNGPASMAVLLVYAFVAGVTPTLCGDGRTGPINGRRPGRAVAGRAYPLFRHFHRLAD